MQCSSLLCLWVPAVWRLNLGRSNSTVRSLSKAGKVGTALENQRAIDTGMRGIVRFAKTAMAAASASMRGSVRNATTAMAAPCASRRGSVCNTETAMAAASASMRGSVRNAKTAMAAASAKRAHYKDCKGTAVCVNLHGKRNCKHCARGDTELVEGGKTEVFDVVVHDLEEMEALAPFLYDV